MSRDVAIFSLSFFFFGQAKTLGIREATKDRSSAFSARRNWPLNAEDAATDAQSVF